MITNTNNITIIPLGTVSPYPKENRNNPGFLIEYKGNNILLDCGNGITRMLDLKKHLNNLHIFITHFHLDHFSDIGALQYASFCYHNLGVIDNPIKIYLPDNENIYKDCIKDSKESFCKYYDISDDKEYYIDDLKISFEDNHSHSIPSYMVKLETTNKKIIYTSDIGITNLSDLIKFCMNSDVLICESSFLEEHKSKKNTHFTAKEAGILAKKTKSDKLFLTHLWPEENRNKYLEEAKKEFEKTYLAEEGKKLVLRR